MVEAIAGKGSDPVNRGGQMDIENTNYALSLLKVLKSKAGQDGKVQVDMGDLCRAAGLEEEGVRESLLDLENEGFITTEIVCTIAEEWR